MATRGTFGFEVDDEGGLLNRASNVERLRRLWLDRSRINGDALGDGDAGDFDYGAWHVSCHLLGGCGVRRRPDGSLVWLELSHDPIADRYYASATTGGRGRATRTARVDSAEGRSLLAGSTLLGFVEGTSLGRTSARNTVDAPGLFNLWRRQDFDQPTYSTADGGRVWEHWCTLRDIRSTHAIGTSALTAFVSLASALGDLFVPTVARGRRKYGHPEQLCAMMLAGFVGKQSALWGGVPTEIPAKLEDAFKEADPATSLKAAASLDWSQPPRYYMFARKLAEWSSAEDVKRDFART